MGQTALHQTYLIAKDNFFKEILKSCDSSSEERRKKSRLNDSSRSRSREMCDERSRSRDKYMNRQNYGQYDG